MTQVIDVWMQHPTLRFLQHHMFASLRRWTGAERPTEELPVEWTIATMDSAGVQRGAHLCLVRARGVGNSSAVKDTWWRTGVRSSLSTR